MKKVPSIRMPDPRAGVIRSAHPREVGMNGLVEAYNWVLRDGNVQVRDGITPVDAPSKTLIAPGASWSVSTGNVWKTALATEPQNVWMDGTKGTLVTAPAAPFAEYEWLWLAGSGGELFIYSTTDPDDAYESPGVEWDSDQDESSVICLVSHDYQGQLDNESQSVVRDQLIAVTDSKIVCYNNDLTVQKTATEGDVDWAWDGAYGPGLEATDNHVKSPKISIDWSNIRWDEFTAGTHGVGIELQFSFFNPAGITVKLWEFTDVASVQDASVVWDKGTSDDDIISANEYQSGQPWELLTTTGTSASYGTGIFFIFTEAWSTWYDELTAQGLSPDDSMFYYWAVYQASESGLPGGEAVVDLDRTLRPVARTWDYEQKTHVLVAAKDKYILDIDADSLAADPAPTVTVAGDAGVSPRARCIGVAAQRIIAGNVSYFDSQLTADNAHSDSHLDSSTHLWHDIVDAFASFPDAVVYSGTVLTGGHTYWYPADILRLADTPGEIVACQEMGTQQIAIYKTDSIYTLTSQSGISPFAPSLRASGISGPVGPRAIVALSDQTHLYLARDGGIYMFSGGTPQSLGEQFRSWIAREIDAESYSDDSFMQFDPERNEVHVYYPVKGSGGVVRKGMIIDVSTQPFTGWPVLWPKQVYNASKMKDSQEDINFICSTIHWEGNQDARTADIVLPSGEVVASPTTKYQELYFGTENEPLDDPRADVLAGRIFKTADIGNDFGIPIEAYMKSGLSDLGDPDAQKVLLELELLFDPIPALSGGEDAACTVTIYGGDSNQDVAQLSTHVVDLAEQMLIHPRVRARYFQYEITITCQYYGPNDPSDPEADWTIGFDEINNYGAIARFKKSGVRQN